jgi:hypothetical protein
MSVGNDTVVDVPLDRCPEASAVHAGEGKSEWNGWASRSMPVLTTLPEKDTEMVSTPALVMVPIQMDSLAEPSFQLPVTLVHPEARALDTPVAVIPVFFTMTSRTHTSPTAVAVTFSVVPPVVVALVMAAAEVMVMN